jgi:thiosulfate/3-mercaptopyruvate sulfurtransferase
MRVMPGHFDSTWSRRTFLRRSVVTGSILAVTGVPALSRATARALSSLQADTSAPLLVDTGWLREQIAAGAPGLVLLDLGDLGDYREGHLPGAVHSYWLETVERDYDVYGTVLNQEDEARQQNNQGKRLAWMRRHGIGPDDHVVAYDHGDGRRAARIVWFLHFLGHFRASLLDGGIAAWRSAGEPIDQDEHDPRSLNVDPVAKPQSGYYLATSELAEALTDPQTQLVDIRTDEERADSVDGQFPTGVIPGSIRAPWRLLMRSDGPGLLPVDTIRGNAEAAGIAPGRRVILYGQFGCDTNLSWLAFRLAGFSSPEVYDRGWAEWSTSGLPVEPLP